MLGRSRESALIFESDLIQGHFQFIHKDFFIADVRVEASDGRSDVGNGESVFIHTLSI